MPDIGTLRERDWDELVLRVGTRECTPFLGAGIAAGVLPTGTQVARTWADNPNINYPLPDKDNLMKVAQYIAIDSGDGIAPKDMMRQLINGAKDPDFSDPGEPHALLAKLPLPLYMTTNYDDFIMKALRRFREPLAPGAPQRFISNWNSRREDQVPIDINCTPESPAVYYFHGYKDFVDTMVLTEDDYLDFIVRISRDRSLIPPRIQEAFVGTSLLFIGYSLNDMNFRVIYRALVETMGKGSRRMGITVQLPYDQPRAAQYLTQYFEAAKLRVFWGTAREFTSELYRRWGKANG